MKQTKKNFIMVAIMASIFFIALAGTTGAVEKIDINTATEQELTQLQKVGPATAARIIEYRKQNKFSKPEDIMNVKGIGPSIWALNKDRITVGGDTASGAVTATQSAANELIGKATSSLNQTAEQLTGGTGNSGALEGRVEELEKKIMSLEKKISELEKKIGKP
jgi:competence protein ComEA